MSLDFTDPISGESRFLGRYLKPGFKYQSTKSVVVPASSSNPAYFVIGGRVVISEADVECRLASNGAGGLAASLALTANTVYYLYAVLNSSGVLSLVADSEPPTSGPQDFQNWTYLGAFSTLEASALLTPFIFSRGHMIATTTLEDKAHTGDTNSTSKTLNALPTTAKTALIDMDISPSAAGQSARVNGESSTSDFNLLQVGQVASQSNHLVGHVPIFTAKTVYVRVSNAAATVTARLMGWMEDPSEYA